jgi:hypothetical protein
MAKSKKNLIEICIDGLEFPLKVGKKSKTEGENTLVTISVSARVEKKFEEQFETNILGIICNSDDYIGLQQLSNKIVSYLNSIDARSIDLIFSFPFFIEKCHRNARQKHSMKYKCQFKVTKNSSFDYSRNYLVEIPVVLKEYLMPGIQKEILDIPALLLIEMEGFDVYFLEDIVELVENQFERLNSSPLSIFDDDNRFSLLEKLENKLSEEFNTDKCTVKLITRKMLYSFSLGLSGERYKPALIDEYETEHIFV